MSGLGATIINYLQLCARISPFFLVLFFVLISFFDGNFGIKGFFYLGCILLVCAIIMVVGTVIGENDPTINIHPICRVFDFPMGDSSIYSPSLNSAIISFTLVYMLMPMGVNNSYNVELIVLIVSLYAVDLIMSSPYLYKCTSWTGIVFGTVFGSAIAAIIVGIILGSKNESLLFFNELKSNNVVCKRPGKQTFKCKVMKNGQIISGFKA